MRSLMARIASIYLKLTKVNDKNFLKEFKKIEAGGEKDWVINPKLISNDIIEDTFEGMKVYYVNSNNHSDKVLFYIHGGYYLHHAVSFHLKMLKKIILQTNAMIVFPVYPLTPFNTVEDSFDKMIHLFEKVQKDYSGKKIILAGDSAGGGYALAVAETLKKQPNELILLSPWVDVTMSNPDIPKYKKVDPMLSGAKAKYVGNIWRGKYDTKDYRVSPLFGDFSKLGNVTIFTGNREIFYPDNVLLYEKIKANESTKNLLIIGDGGNHVYPAYPTPEGKEAVKQISEIINR